MNKPWMRLFLDANVLFSAAYMDKSRPGSLFRLAEAGLCELIASPYAIEEARRNLAFKRVERLSEFARLTAVLTICPEPSKEYIEWALAQGLGLQDAPILAAAAQTKSGLLVTGDRTDFGHLYRRILRGVEVLPPAEALDRILSAAGL
ncbi:MAG: PIN domain-containing protein [Pseudomonadota bacterium]